MEYVLTSKQYQEALKEGRLLGLRCNKCSEYTAPPKKVCLECGSEDLRIVELSGKGKIKTFTVVRVPPEGFEGPYIVAMVKLEEGPWVMGRMMGMDPDQADMNLIGRKIMVGHLVWQGDKFSGGEVTALAFKMVD